VTSVAALASHATSRMISKGNKMDLNLNLYLDEFSGQWAVWNKTNNSEFRIKFECRDAAITFMVQFIAEVKQ